MSLFSKVLSRAAAPSAPTVPSARPKGLGGLLHRHEMDEEETQPLRRQEEDEEVQPLRREPQEEEELQTLRRQEEEEEMQPLRRREEEEEEMQSLRRQEEEEMQSLRRQEEEEEELQTLRRQEEEEEEMQPLRRQEEEEEATLTLRRQEEEEEQMQPLRRQPEEEEEAEIDMQALRRTANPASEELPETQIDNPEFMDEPSAAQALRRSDAPAAATGEGAAPGQAAAAPNFPTSDTDPGRTVASLPPAVPLSERPRVHIDQIDVTIQEPTPASAGPSKDTGADLSRLLSGRYLRGV